MPSPPPPEKHIVFDVVGTLVSYTHFFSTLGSKLGPVLKPHNISAHLLGFAWLESAEREYTYLSLSGSYIPFAKVFEAIFFRVLHFAGIPEPREIATEDDVRYFMQEYRKCEVRPGAKELVQRLKDEGWTVWAFTSSERERVMGYFEKGGVAIEGANVITCDEIGVGKPEIKAYERVKERLGGVEGKALWFAAAHGWDVSAAGRAGFKTAYCTVLEKEPLEDIFGKQDVVAESLLELADGIIAATA
ncbi:HAD-like protein [Pyrenochaeta sp. DS3sAY3a]|nr:HAD-like protein [Pyrenochaeta sp. DS3sAY3a]